MESAQDPFGAISYDSNAMGWSSASTSEFVNEAVAGSRVGVARLCCWGVVWGEVSSWQPSVSLLDKNDGVPVNR